MGLDEAFKKIIDDIIMRYEEEAALKILITEVLPAIDSFTGDRGAILEYLEKKVDELLKE